MLQFINIANGTVYSGVKPYTHWFDEGQSVNINYTKEIVFTSDEQTTNITIEDNPYFKLMQFNTTPSTENINDFDYYNIQNFLSTNLSLEGIQYGNVYLYRFFVYAFSSDTGEYKVDINISDETIEVGADFYPENELLTNDLENLGIEIPMQIQKAIYESNVHEEAMDNILMNRKWKELLLEYWNIVACKGSYRSLVNSMKFFEYGDLVKIMEFWKVHYNKDIYISNDIEQILNDRFREQLSVLSKTTYIGLYLALEKIKRNEDGTYLSERDLFNANALTQDNPVLEKVSTLWNAVDLSLKMTLVGNFFSTYFMPLHLDLIHSTIENIVFTNTIKMFSTGWMYRRDYVDLCGHFHSSVKNGSNYYIKPQDVYVTPRTILGYKDFVIDNESFSMIRDSEYKEYVDTVKYLGVDTVPDLSYLGSGSGTGSGPGSESSSIYDIIFSAENLLHVFGALIPIDARITTNVGQGDAIKSAQVNWVRDSKQVFSYIDNEIWIDSKTKNGDNMFDFNFNLLITNPGTYHIFITFTSTRSFVYSHEFYINVLDDADNPIHIYKVERIDPAEYKDLDISINNNKVIITGNEYTWELNEFMQSMTHGKDNYALNWAGTQYICGDIKNLSTHVGLNHIIMFTLKNNSEDALIGEIPASEASAQILNDAYPDYWWLERKVYTELNTTDMITQDSGDGKYYYNSGDGTIENETTVIIGIRKYFTIESEIVTLYEKTFKKGSTQSIVTIYQKGPYMYTSISNTGNGLGSIKLSKLSDTVKFEVFGHKMEVRVHPDYDYIKLEKDNGTGRPKGHIDDKIKTSGRFYQLVDEDRFIPIFHKLVKVDESNCDICKSELIVAIPEDKRTYTDATEIVWTFKNSSTLESISTQKVLRNEYSENHLSIYEDTSAINFTEPLIGKFEPRVLTPGYYNIDLNYKYAGTQHNESRNAAFRIIKED